MKCTNFKREILEIRANQEIELRKAVEAHGGEYDWPGDSVIVGIHYNDTIKEAQITHIAIWKDSIVMNCITDNDFYVRITLNDVLDTHIHYITEAIEETEEVKDVTENETLFKITSVSRDDLESRGFYTDGVDDDDMRTLAGKMADDYCDQLFWESMDTIAEIMDIPRIWDVWFKNLTPEGIKEMISSDDCCIPEDGDDTYTYEELCENWWNGKFKREKKEFYEDFKGRINEKV